MILLGCGGNPRSRWCFDEVRRGSGAMWRSGSWKRCGFCCLACIFLREGLWAFYRTVDFGLIYQSSVALGVALPDGTVA